METYRLRESGGSGNVGKLVMVEREANRPKLMEFYNKNGFKSWTRRFDEKSKVEFDQMFAVLNDEPTGGPGS